MSNKDALLIKFLFKIAPFVIIFVVISYVWEFASSAWNQASQTSVWQFLFNTLGLTTLLVLLVSVVAIVYVIKKVNRTRRINREAEERRIKRQRLRKLYMDMYDDEDIVERIMEKEIWEGETAEQLEYSLGQPEDIEKKVLKTKTKETWKYDHKGANRYGKRVYIENGEVVGWEYK